MILQRNIPPAIARFCRTRRLLVTSAAVLTLLPPMSSQSVLAQTVGEVSVPNNGILTVSYSSDGKQIAGGSFDKTVKIWNASTGEVERTLVGHQGTVRTVAFAAHGSVLASGSDDKTTILWDTKTGNRLRTLRGFKSQVFALKFSTDGDVLWTGSGDLKAWDVATGEAMMTIPTNSRFVLSIDISKDGTTLVATSFNADRTVSAQVFELPSGRLLRRIGGKDFGVYRACFLPDGKHVASSFYSLTDGPSIRTWDNASGEEQQSFRPKTKEIWAIALSANGKFLATGGEGPVVKTRRETRSLSGFTVWDLKSGEAKMTHEGSLGRLTSLCFSPNNQRVVYCDSATVSVVDVESSDEVWSASFGAN